METRKIRILGTGKYLPKKTIYSYDLDKKMQKPIGWVKKKSGATKRHFVDKETLSEMAAHAAIEALDKAKVLKEEIDCIIFASASKEQLIPNTASIIQKKLGLENSGIPAIDINTTCLSFLTGLDFISYLIHAHKYKKILIVSSEIASIGLNWNDPNTCTIFGDGAAAAIISRSNDDESSKILSSHMETYSSGSDFAELKACGSLCYPTDKLDFKKENYFFHMKGKESFKLVSKVMPKFINTLLEKSGKTIDEIDLLIPHQASHLALKHIQKLLKIPDNKFMNIFASHGNQISVSIPMALHEAVVKRKIKRGSIIMLLGSSAGISLGGIILEY